MSGELDTTYRQVSPVDLTATLDAVKSATNRNMNAVQIGTIVNFDATKQLATVQVSLKQIISVDPNGVKTLAEYPALGNVPCMTLFGGNAFLSMPIQAGDNCIVLFNDVEIDQWLVSGNGQTPITTRSHDISDAIAIVGIRSLQNSIADYIANGVRMSYSENSRITLTDDQIESVAGLFKHNGTMEITGDLIIGGDMTSIGGAPINIDVTLTQTAGKEIHAGNGASGTFTSVTVVDGIVTGGTP